MNENKENQQIRTPIGVMMDMAKNEIGNLVFSCMENSAGFNVVHFEVCSFGCRAGKNRTTFGAVRCLTGEH